MNFPIIYILSQIKFIYKYFPLEATFYAVDQFITAYYGNRKLKRKENGDVLQIFPPTTISRIIFTT